MLNILVDALYKTKTYISLYQKWKTYFNVYKNTLLTKGQKYMSQFKQNHSLSHNHRDTKQQWYVCRILIKSHIFGILIIVIQFVVVSQDTCR